MATSCCDNGWKHLCGGPHAVDPGDDREVVPPLPAEEGGCRTVRCDKHCSCFAPDGEHDALCAKAGS